MRDAYNMMLAAGDYIVYTVRNGSSMYLRQGQIVYVADDYIRIKAVKQGWFNKTWYGYRTTLRSNTTLVKVPYLPTYIEEALKWA